MSDKINERRRLRFTSEADALAELARLRLGSRHLKNWTFAQICRHLVLPMERFLAPPQTPDPTPQEAAAKAAFLDVILTTGRPPPNFEAPPEFVPPQDCNEADVDRLENALRRLQAYPHPLVAMGPFGPVPIADCRRFNLGHCAHHFGYLVPTESQTT